MPNGQDPAVQTQAPAAPVTSAPASVFADPQQGQQPMSEQSGIPGIGTNVNPAEMFRAMMAQMQTGQQMGPNPAHQQRQVQPFQRQPVGGGNTASEALASFSANLHNALGQVGQMIQQRKASHEQVLFDRYINSQSGIMQAQQQMREAQAAIQQNPQDQEAIYRLQQAQLALQQNQTTQNSIFGGPQGERNYKTLAKGFGIDDKNAGTPERQRAKEAYAKAFGVGDRAAQLGSQLPMNVQQMGPPGMKPPTGNALLAAQGRAAGQATQRAIAELRANVTREGASERNEMFAAMHGMKISKDPTTGQSMVETMTPEERAKVPYLKAQDDAAAAKTAFDRAKTDALNNPNSPEMKRKMMEAYAHQKDADARMISAQASQTRAMIAKMAGPKEPPEAVAARKTADAMDTAYANAQDYLKNPTPTNVNALIVDYTKAQIIGAGRLNPYEIEMTMNSPDVQTRMKNLYDRYTAGKLDKKFMQQMVDTIKTASTNARKTADKYGPGPGAGAGAAAAPAAGETEDKSWDEMQQMLNQ